QWRVDKLLQTHQVDLFLVRNFLTNGKLLPYLYYPHFQEKLVGLIRARNQYLEFLAVDEM
uniref:hypothetical protein n=1 Tax=Okeania sp. SIO2F4 TaxID=2607790 RepID=UPI0025F5B007